MALSRFQHSGALVGWGGGHASSPAQVFLALVLELTSGFFYPPAQKG